MSNLIATKRVDLLAPYLALDQGPKVMAECESFLSSLSRVVGGVYGIVEEQGGVYAVLGMTRASVWEDYGHPASLRSLVVHPSVLRQLPHPQTHLPNIHSP